ncbi:Vms1/Ankzf1 family peptidyl-tRNA hydrolase [Mycobacterium sp. 141]|uniref:Rv2629 family ribosome hibernation factor n=1 Tax=Mycobacterium sp. 141 TaxID=1120797 RepID=UPI00037048D7|nr:Vms1/Ankzf1 family peptidyl-tRNA hydrolase [Mycobacterium sp. 141]
MNTEVFRRLVDVSGPFVSVYLDDSRSDATNRADVEWHAIRSKLERMQADPAAVERLEKAVLNSRPPVGRQGRAVVVTPERILINEHLPRVPIAPVVRVSDYPYLLPLMQFGDEQRPYVFAAIDRSGATITVHQDGAVRTETVEGEGYPVHRPATSGPSGYVDFQRTTDEAIRTNIRAVSDRLVELVDEVRADVVIVSGEVRSRSDVISALPPRVAQRVSQLPAGSHGHRASEAEFGDLVEDALRRLGCAEVGETVQRFLSEKEAESGLAVAGIAAVCRALVAHNVDALIIGQLGDATVVTGPDRTMVGPDADSLSALGKPVSRVARADEAIPFAGLAVDASLVSVGDALDLADGIGALLRFAPADMG